MCLYLRFIKNPRYQPNQKNGGQTAPLPDPRIAYVPTTCGNCIECRKKKARDWQTRLYQEVKHTPHGYFITLTFSQQSLHELSNKSPLTGYTLDNHIATIATRRFLERWRKQHKVSLRHWLITELGHKNTERIHLHGIIWFQNKQDILKLQHYWKYGITWQGDPITKGKTILGYKNYVDESTISYISKYITKTDNQHKYYKPIILATPGIGNQYTKSYASQRNHYNGTQTHDNYKTTTGHTISLPIYYRTKLYNDTERENLWINTLNRNERYVLGTKININHGQQNYLTALRQARETNRRLGYGDNKIDINRKEQENLQRHLLQQERKKPMWGHSAPRPPEVLTGTIRGDMGAYAPPESRPPDGNALTKHYLRTHRE